MVEMRMTAGWRWLLGVTAVMALGGCAAPEEFEAPSQTQEAGLAGGALVWVKQLGSPLQDEARAVAFDRDGNILMLFQYQGSVDLGGGPVGSGNPNQFGFAVAKYTSGGALLWTRNFEGDLSAGAQAFISAPALAVDRERNVIISGESALPLNLGGGVQPAGAFLLKLRKTGQFQWARHFTGIISPRDLVTDSHDAIALTGTAYLTVDFGQGPVSSQVTDVTTTFLTKFNAAGTPRWTLREQLNLSGGTSVAVDEADDLYLAGFWYPDPEVWKVTPSGAVTWKRRLDGAAGAPLGVAVHGNRVVAGGQFNFPFTFAGKNVPNPSSGNGGFLVAWTRAGDERWAKSYPQVVGAVAMGEDDSVVVGGHDTAASSASGYKLFTARLDRIGGQQHWLRAYDVTERPYFTDVSVNKQGAFVGAGYYSGTLRIGGTNYVSRGAEDGFLLKGLTGH
ncbi:hypothetical protein OV208_12180 [Corallococcus sp. bb12-1]|uniref:hypothetical protein n=1 Tax=Corallococcus sp. bb12-1 TaxID=2996784 RepID=UPI00226DED86|nr:hypothetical protein [Corallococcus sp. bb12-1]MCY1042075.1 hypothetical protein [Corallococcus sp. bb12-1]